MSYLENFTDDQKRLLIALPYRAGLWVSESDSVGGDEADEAEMVALEGIITGFAQDFCKSEFVEEIMKQTLAGRAQWGEWSKDLNRVLGECQQAVGLLQERLEDKEVESFKHNLMDIAEAVAMAYREFDDEQPLAVRLMVYTRYYFDVFIARLKKEMPPRLDEVLNISQQEEKALTDLSKALRLERLAA